MKNLIVGAVLSCVATSSWADWQVAPDASTLAFTSTKNETIHEIHRFTQVSGGVSPDGKASVIVALPSVDTMIPIRDERMGKHLFNTHPVATYVADVSVADVQKLVAGESRHVLLRGQLSINGKTMDLPVAVVVAKQASGAVLVSGGGTLDVASLGFGGGIEALREIAGLASISTDVNFSLRLTLVDQ